jgi:hypothetical protein
MYDKLCTVTADTASVALGLPKLFRPDGRGYYALHVVIELLFGLTEYEARICWTENVSSPFNSVNDQLTNDLQGQERRCECSIAYTQSRWFTSRTEDLLPLYTISRLELVGLVTQLLSLV